jgi:hypothetical protein
VRSSFLLPHVRVDRQDGWDLHHRDDRQRRAVLRGEPRGDVDRLLGLRVLLDRHEQAPVAVQDTRLAAYARASAVGEGHGHTTNVERRASTTP